MLEAGIPEVHAQRFMGHETRSIFDRYAISSRTVLRSQAKKLGEHYGDSAPEPEAEGCIHSRQGSGKVSVMRLKRHAWKPAWLQVTPAGLEPAASGLGILIEESRQAAESHKPPQ